VWQPIRENRKPFGAYDAEVPEMRREGATDDFGRGDPVQRLGMVRDGLQGQEFRRYFGGRFGRWQFGEIGGYVFGLEADGVKGCRLEIKRIKIERREVFQREGDSEEKEVKYAALL
jgi:hypothetical protein